jgi:hypothetical protein
MFIVNLAFSDMCMITTQGLPVAINAFVQDYWMWGAKICEVSTFYNDHHSKKMDHFTFKFVFIMV